MRSDYISRPCYHIINIALKLRMETQMLIFIVIIAVISLVAAIWGIIYFCRVRAKKKRELNNNILRMRHEALDEALSNPEMHKSRINGYVIRLEFEGIDRPPFFAEDAKNISIGRSADNDLILNDNNVSKHHCRISCDSQGYFIEDLGSKNGTLVKQHGKITSLYSQKKWLEQGDCIIAGSSVLVYKKLKCSE